MRRYLIFILALIILASCQSELPEYEWCYVYDFTVDDYDFNVSTGEYIEGVGFSTTDGVISVSYDFGSFVTPTSVHITLKRPDGYGTLQVQSAGIVYGTTIDTQSIPYSNVGFGWIEMPNNINQFDVLFTPNTEGDAGSSINVTTNVRDVTNVEEGFDGGIYIPQLVIYGHDPTPFPVDNCAEDTTPTVAPEATSTIPATATSESEATYTPSPTPTSTFTPSPTNTPTITNTPEPVEWCHTLDFTMLSYASVDGVTVGNIGGWGNGYTSGTGWRSSDHMGIQELLKVNVVFPDDITVTYLEYTTDSDTSNFDVSTGHVIAIDYREDGIGWTRTGAIDPSGANAIFTHVAYDSTGLYIDELIFVGNPQHSGKWFLAELEIHGTGDSPYPSLTNECGPPTPTPTPTYTPEDTITPTATLTPFSIPTNTPYNFQPTVDLTQTTATVTTTPQPTSTNLPQSTAYATQTIGAGTPTLSVEEIRENEAEWELLEEAKRGNNAIENLLQDILDALSGDGGEGEGDSGDGGTGEGDTFIDGVEGWTSAISNSLYGVQQAFGKVGGLLGQSVGSANALVTSFYTAQPIPIPGLPLCMTAPLEHDICAIYYILDWTLFAPETYGAFIVPLILAIINVIVIFKVLGYVLKLVKRTEDVTR